MKLSFLLKYTSLALFSGFGVTSCSWMLLPPEESEIEKPAGFLKQLNAGSSSSPAQTHTSVMENPSATMGVNSLEDIEKKQKESGVIFTDPDNPDAPIAALEEAFTGKHKTDWFISYTEALQEAMREQKPLLMWFTDSRNSPTSTQLSNELLSKPKFSEWCGENLVRLRLDMNVSDPNDTVTKGDSVKKEDYLKDLCKKYNVMGFPRLIMLTPDGQVVDTLAGYTSGAQDFVKRRIVNSARLAAKQFQTTKQHLEGMGYRSWTGKNGTKIFAKLRRYSDEKGGTLTLQEVNGHMLQTQLYSLSAADARWVQAEKAKRQPSPQNKG